MNPGRSLVEPLLEALRLVARHEVRWEGATVTSFCARCGQRCSESWREAQHPERCPTRVARAALAAWDARPALEDDGALVALLSDALGHGSGLDGTCGAYCVDGKTTARRIDRYLFGDRASPAPGDGERETQAREPGCQCDKEIGDSPCRVHGEEEETGHGE